MKMKYILTALVSLVLLCVLLTAPTSVLAADGDNLAANGDLELGNTNAWEIDAAAIDSTVKHGGNYSLKLTATSAYSGAAYKAIPVRKNATVTVSFYYRYAENPSGKLYHVYTYMGDNPWVGTYSNADASFAATSSNYATWKQVTYTFNSGDYEAIYLKFCPGGSGSVPCYIDDLAVTSVGGDEVEEAPYLTAFGTKMNRPSAASYNVIQNGGFESTASAQWNVADFIKGNLSVVADATAPEGENSLYFDGGSATTSQRHTFSVSVEKYTQYTFSAWVKSPRLSADNRGTATFGVANGETGEFLVYEPYNGNGHGAASLSTPEMQLMATSPDGEWHLRSVTLYSGSASTLQIVVRGAESQLYLDDMALFPSAFGVEYISALRTDVILAADTVGNRYCADEDSLIKGVYMTTDGEKASWSENPAWRNGFLSFANVGDGHGAALQYTASAHTEWELHYIDWIDVQPNISYTLTLDVKRLTAGGGRVALLDDDYDAPKEFYAIAFDAADSDWATYSVTFNSGAYSRIGFAIVDGGGSALIDEVRLFDAADGVADRPDTPQDPVPVLKPLGGATAVMEMVGGEMPMVNSDFEEGTLSGWVTYQHTVLSGEAAYGGGYGAHLKGDGSWGALLEQQNVPVSDGETYTLSLWYKANAVGANVSMIGNTTGTQYTYLWAANGQWTHFSATFTVDSDTALLFNICGGGNGNAEDVYVDNIRLIPANSTAKLGVAFLMELEGYHITMDGQNRFDAPNATVIPYGDGEAYPLLRMGAVMTNDAAVGTSEETFTLSAVNRQTVTEIPAVYLWSVSDTGCKFAVRVINVPLTHSATPIYARPYYVFEKDGEEVVVYGDVCSRSYDG